MAERTAEEARNDYVEKMGEVLGTQFHALIGEVAFLHIKWAEYVELFGDPENVKLLNKSAPAFFSMIQRILWEETLLHICRLTDPPESKVKKTIKRNLTLQALPELLSDSERRVRLKELVDEAICQSDFCRDWRNRHIAHLELDLALKKEPATPLAVASRNHVNQALHAIEGVLHAVGEYYSVFLAPFEESIGALGNARSLLYVLRDGVKEKERRRERRHRGDSSKED